MANPFQEAIKGSAGTLNPADVAVPKIKVPKRNPLFDAAPYPNSNIFAQPAPAPAQASISGPAEYLDPGSGAGPGGAPALPATGDPGIQVFASDEPVPSAKEIVAYGRSQGMTSTEIATLIRKFHPEVYAQAQDKVQQQQIATDERPQQGVFEAAASLRPGGEVDQIMEQGTRILTGLGDELQTTPRGEPRRQEILAQMKAVTDIMQGASDRVSADVNQNAGIGFLKNASSSLYNLGKGAAKSAVHLLDPRPDHNTFMQLIKVGSGVLEKTIRHAFLPEGTAALADEKYIDALGQKINTDWGITDLIDAGASFAIGDHENAAKSLDDAKFKIAKRAYEDPAGVALDVSTMLSIAGYGLKLADKAGMLPKILTTPASVQIAGRTLPITAGLSKDLSLASAAVNPFVVAGRTAKVVYKAGKYVAAKVAGFTTGRGSTAAAEIIEHPGDTNAGLNPLKRRQTAERVLDEAKDAQRELYKGRAAEGEIAYGKLKLDQKVVSAKAAAGLQDDIASALEKKQILQNADGTLDFSNSALQYDAKAQKIANGLWEKVQAIAKPARGYEATFQDIQNIKRLAGDLYVKTGDVSNLVTGPIKTAMNDALRSIPGYAAADAKWAAASNMIDDVNSAIMSGDKVAAQGAFNKLSKAMNDNDILRKAAMDQMANATTTGRSLVADLAGYQYSAVLPVGLVNTLIVKGGAIGAIGALSYLFTPSMLMALPFMVPQVVGRMLQAVGIFGKALDIAVQAITTIPVTALNIAASNSVVQNILDEEYNKPQDATQ